MFNLAYGMVRLVAIVRKIEYTSTKITYTLEDHTGRVEAHYWLDDESGKQPKVTQNAYATILGSLRKVGDQNVVIIYHAEEVLKINEVTTHLLEVLFCRFKAEQYSKAGGAALVKGVSSGFGEMSVANAYSHVGGGQPMDTNEQAGPLASHGMTGKNSLIFQAIEAGNLTNNLTGITRQELYDKFPKIQHSEMDDILEFLIHEGHTYSTVSCDHFKTVD